MLNTPPMLFKGPEENEDETVGDAWELNEDPAKPIDEGWGDVPTIPVGPELDAINPDEISPASEALPVLRPTTLDITPSSAPRVVKENPKQAKAFAFWIELHQEGKLSSGQIDNLTAENSGVSIAALRQWKANCEWVKRRVAEVGDQTKEKILAICGGLEKVEEVSIAIINKYLDQLMKSTYTLDRPTIKLMQELVEFARRNLDEFSARLFERRVSSITAGVSLTIRKD